MIHTFHTPFLHSPMKEHLGQFYLLVIENSATRSMYADIFLTYLLNSMFDHFHFYLYLKDYT